MGLVNGLAGIATLRDVAGRIGRYHACETGYDE
jgi:hypothetical protein